MFSLKLVYPQNLARKKIHCSLWYKVSLSGICTLILISLISGASELIMCVEFNVTITSVL